MGDSKIVLGSQNIYIALGIPRNKTAIFQQVLSGPIFWPFFGGGGRGSLSALVILAFESINKRGKMKEQTQEMNGCSSKF